MTYKIKFLPIAIEDYKDIKKYLQGYLKNTAKRFVTELNSKLDLIIENPLMYPKYMESRPFRKMVIDKDYILFYLVNDMDKIIEIYRIFPSVRNVNSILRSSGDIDDKKYVHKDKLEYK